jgi:uncharacterized protein (DUF736 family)
MDDPVFSRPIDAAMFVSENADVAQLLWSRHRGD